MSCFGTDIIKPILAVTLALVLHQSASAQANHPRSSRSAVRGPASSPYQQRLSPYLDLFRADNSLLSPYHSFVQPRRNVRQNMSRQSSQIDRLERSAFGQQARSPDSPTSRLPTGRGGSFQSYLHFYRFDNRLPSQ